MIEITTNKTMVKKMVETEVPTITSVTITLPIKYARALMTLVGSLAGIHGVFRNLTDEIYYALKEAGVTSFRNEDGSFAHLEAPPCHFAPKVTND